MSRLLRAIAVILLVYVMGGVTVVAETVDLCLTGIQSQPQQMGMVYFVSLNTSGPTATLNATVKTDFSSNENSISHPVSICEYQNGNKDDILVLGNDDDAPGEYLDFCTNTLQIDHGRSLNEEDPDKYTRDLYAGMVYAGDRIYAVDAAGPYKDYSLGNPNQGQYTDYIYGNDSDRGGGLSDL